MSLGQPSIVKFRNAAVAGRGAPGQPLFPGGRPQDAGDIASQEEDVRNRIISVEILETDIGADECTLRLENSDLSLFGNPLLFPQSIFEIVLGYETRRGTPQVFRIVEIKGFRDLTVRALGREYELDRVQRKETYNNVTIAQVASLVAQRHNLFPVVQQTFGVHQQIVQSGESDAEFLQRLAESIGFVWFIQQDSSPIGRVEKLFFLERAFEEGGFPVEVVEIGKDPRVLGDPDFEVDIANVFGVAQGALYNPIQKLYEDLTATVEDTRRRVLGSSTPITEDSKLSIPSTITDRLAAQEEIDGFYKEFERQMLRCTFRMQGDPLFRPKRLLVMEGVGPLFRGPYYIDSIRYRLAPGESFTMELSLRKNAFSFTATDIAIRFKELDEVRKDFQARVQAARDARLAEDQRAKLSSIQPSPGPTTGGSVVNIAGTAFYAKGAGK